MTSEAYNEDCMLLMARYPDKHFDLAVVDPPYFTGPEKRNYYGNSISSHGVKRINYKPLLNSWKIPDESYFKELIRVSKNQIIWGCNYYKYIYNGTGRIIWDKCNDGSSFSGAEIAYCSLINSVRVFRFMWRGMMWGKSISEGHIMQGDKTTRLPRIHPTEKPIQLYQWINREYAKPGDKILDTHLGSGSSRIAAYDMGYDFVGCELDKDYFDASVKRFEQYKAQLKLF